ncbi:hypothetical protein CBL_04293 [Carabus blaptoides fortunei]
MCIPTTKYIPRDEVNVAPAVSPLTASPFACRKRARRANHNDVRTTCFAHPDSDLKTGRPVLTSSPASRFRELAGGQEDLVRPGWSRTEVRDDSEGIQCRTEYILIADPRTRTHPTCYVYKSQTPTPTQPHFLANAVSVNQRSTSSPTGRALTVAANHHVEWGTGAGESSQSVNGFIIELLLLVQRYSDTEEVILIGDPAKRKLIRSQSNLLKAKEQASVSEPQSTSKAILKTTILPLHNDLLTHVFQLFVFNPQASTRTRGQLNFVGGPRFRESFEAADVIPIAQVRAYAVGERANSSGRGTMPRMSVVMSFANVLGPVTNRAILAESYQLLYPKNSATTASRTIYDDDDNLVLHQSPKIHDFILLEIIVRALSVPWTEAAGTIVTAVIANDIPWRITLIIPNKERHTNATMEETGRNPGNQDLRQRSRGKEKLRASRPLECARFNEYVVLLAVGTAERQECTTVQTSVKPQRNHRTY